MSRPVPFTELSSSNWIRNSTITETDEGSCYAKTIKDSQNKSKYNSSNGYTLDNLVCGDDVDDFGCKYVDQTEWTSIWQNCEKSKSPSVAEHTENPSKSSQDFCYNSALDTTEGKSDFDIDTNDFNPRKVQQRDLTLSDIDGIENCNGLDHCEQGKPCGQWDDTFGADDCFIGNVKTNIHNESKEGRPAYPTRFPGISGNYWEGDSQEWNGSYMLSNLDSCKSPFTRRQLFCDLTGGAVGSNGFGDGCGGEISSDTTSNYVRFCSRDKGDWQNLNIANCCLGEETSKKNCPWGYCNSKVDGAAQECIPDSDGKCNTLTTKCNQFFNTQCSNEVFQKGMKGEYTDNDDKEFFKKCIRWTTIQPNEYKTRAPDICTAPLKTIIDQHEGADGNTKLLELLSNPEHKATVESILSNTLCREYFRRNIDSEPNIQSTLRKLCYNTVQENPDGSWSENTSDNGGKIRNNAILQSTCPCNLPDEYYTWYKDNELVSDSDGQSNCSGDSTSRECSQFNIESSLSRSNTKPPCYYQKCTRSGFYHNVDGCPAIQLCVNVLNEKTSIVPGTGSVSLPPLGDQNSEIDQSCNLGAVNKTLTSEERAELENIDGSDGTTTTPSSGTPSSGTPSSSPTSGDTSVDSFDFSKPSNIAIGAICICIFIAIIYFMMED